MTIFIFVRHGFSENNLHDTLETDPDNKVKLTKDGVEQAKEVAKQLGSLKVSRIYSSTIYRAYETAEIIDREFGLDIIKDKRLVDRNAGKMNGKPNRSGRWRLGLTDKEFEELLVESWQSIKRRVISFMKSVKDNGIVVVVTHEDTIKAVLSYILNLDEMQIYGLTVKNCSISIIERKNNEYMLIGAGLPILTDKIAEEIRHSQSK